MKGWTMDLRVALRSLARQPTFTAVAIGTLALGIGANTAVFTLVDGVLLSPLPFDRSEQLVSIRHLARDGQDRLSMSQGLYVLYRDQASSLADIGLFAGNSVNLVAEGEPDRVQAQAVTPGFFGTLAVEPALGRTFTEAEGLPGGEQVVVLSDGLWRTRFGADPGILEKAIDVNGISYRIVGVMPRDFGHPDREALLWLPMIVDPAQAPLGAFGAGGVARLATGSSIEGLHAELQGLITRLPELFPGSGTPAFLSEAGLEPSVRPLKEDLVGEVSATLWILLGMVGLVLLIACANVANLLLVRAEGRSRELALRMALGAGRMDVFRAFLSESVLLAVAGGVLGVLVAGASVRLTFGLIPTDLPRMVEIGVDGRVLAFTAALAIGCAAFFGLFPLLRARGRDLAGELRAGEGRGATGGRAHHRLRSGLVVGQVALALVLLIGSGLMFRSFQALRAVEPGFDSSRVLTARISVPAAEVPNGLEAAGFFRALGDRLRDQPGVEAVGFAASAPLVGGLGFFEVGVEDAPRGEDELPILVTHNFAEQGYFEAMGIDILEGRTFRAGDGAEGARVAVVGRAFAERWWPGRSPIGRRIRLGGPDADWFAIVGVVDDVRHAGLEEEPAEVVYWPATTGPAEAPQPTRTMDIVIKTAGHPLAFVGALRREVQEINPRIPVSSPRSMDDVVAAASARTSFTAALLGTASGIALFLGLVGIYGVVSYIVAQRTREIGVRMALGATHSSVRMMVVRQGLTLASIGTIIGILAASALSSLLESILFGVDATDPLTYGSVALTLIAVSLLATWIPAARAARVEPSTALRSG